MKLANAFHAILLTFLASPALASGKATKHRPADADEPTSRTRILKGSKCLSPTRQEDRVAKIYETYTHDYLICEGGGVTNQYNPATSKVETGGFFDAQLDSPSTGQPAVIPFRPVSGVPSNIAGKFVLIDLLISVVVYCTVALMALFIYPIIQPNELINFLLLHAQRRLLFQPELAFDWKVFEFGPFGAGGNFLTGVWNFVDDSIALVQGNTNDGLTDHL